MTTLTRLPQLESGLAASGFPNLKTPMAEGGVYGPVLPPGLNPAVSAEEDGGTIPAALLMTSLLSPEIPQMQGEAAARAVMNPVLFVAQQSLLNFYNQQMENFQPPMATGDVAVEEDDSRLLDPGAGPTRLLGPGMASAPQSVTKASLTPCGRGYCGTWKGNRRAASIDDFNHRMGPRATTGGVPTRKGGGGGHPLM